MILEVEVEVSDGLRCLSGCVGLPRIGESLHCVACVEGEKKSVLGFMDLERKT